MLASAYLRASDRYAAAPCNVLIRCLDPQDREMREAGALTQSAETASEVRNHSAHTAARNYSAHGRRQRIISYSKEFRQVVMVSNAGCSL